MELLPVLRILWRRRWLVVVGAVAAVLVAYVLQSTPMLGSGTAAAQVMLDTPRSDLASAAVDDTANLPNRAAFIAHAMTSDEVRNRLARSLGVPADRLALIDASFRSPVAPTTLPLAASEAAVAAPEPYLLQMRFDGITPMIWMEARGPNPADAARLVDAAVKDLATTHPPTKRGPTYKPIMIERVSDTRVHQLVTAQGRMVAVMAAGMLLVVWCLFLIVTTRLADWLRERREHVVITEPRAEPT